MRNSKVRGLFFGLLILLMFFQVTLAKDYVTETNYSALFNEVFDIVEQNFYDAKAIESRFMPIKESYSEKVRDVATPSEFADLVNRMLSRLQASHTTYYTPDDVLYYHLSAVFSQLPQIRKLFGGKEIIFPSVGIFTEDFDGKVFIDSVLSGSPAEKAGLMRGDEIVSVNGKAYTPVASLRPYVGEKVLFAIRRHSGENSHSIWVEPVMVNPKTQMLEAQEKSIRIIKKDHLRIGYIHVWSYAGEEFHRILLDAISWGKLKDADALIWDLRYGLGGANPEYLNFLNPNVPAIQMMDKNGNTLGSDRQWRKPLVMLVNGTVRSGKELLAFGVKKFRLGTVIGEGTAGAFLGGKLFPISNGDLLYLAVGSATVDGVQLEGNGVEPDILIQEDVRYCAGKDIQLEKAIEYITETFGAK